MWNINMWSFYIKNSINFTQKIYHKHIFKNCGYNFKKDLTAHTILNMIL